MADPALIWVRLNIVGLPGLAWVQIEPAAAKVNRRLEMLDVPEAAGHARDLLNLAVESLTHRVGHRMMIMPADRLGHLANRLQPAVHCPEGPPFPELPA